MKRFIIPIFIPHLGCPHQCVFCDQRKITGVSDAVNPDYARNIIQSYLNTRKAVKASEEIQVAFYGGSFTGLTLSSQESLLQTAYSFVEKGKVDSLRLSTRPDYINKECLRLLKKYGVKTVELGVQSMNDYVLQKANRGHTSENVRIAFKLLRKFGFEIGIQIMPGLPGDNLEKILFTTNEVILLKPDFVRIYPTIVIENTPLERILKTGEYQALSLEEAVDICKKILLKLRKNDIKVIRIGLQPDEDLNKCGVVVAGPYHPAFRQLVESAIAYDMMKSLLNRNKCFGNSITYYVNPKELSNYRGQKNNNLIKLKKVYGNEALKICADEEVAYGNLIMDNGCEQISLSQMESFYEIR